MKSYIPFNPQPTHLQGYDLYNQPDTILDLAIQKADLYKEQQQAELTRIDEKCMLLLNISIAIAVALLGGLVAIVSSGNISKAFAAPILFELCACVAVMWIVFKGAMYKRGSSYAGRQPASLFSERILKVLKDAPQDWDKGKLQKVYYLMDTQISIDANDAEALCRIRAYRSSVMTLMISLTLSILGSLTVFIVS